VITLRTASDLLAARDRVQQAAEGIAGGIFEPRPGMHCNFCAYRSLCPEREKRIPRRIEAKAARPN
jgi:PD-(D/E)XK nuclease superfamily